MEKRFERYNEITFEAYCKITIDRAVLKARMEKAERAKRETSLDELKDADLYRLCGTDGMPDFDATEPIVFFVQDRKVGVQNPGLGQALQYLHPQMRAIILLAYFIGMNDGEIARQLDMSKSAVQRWRISGLKRLRELMEGTR